MCIGEMLKAVLYFAFNDRANIDLILHPTLSPVNPTNRFIEGGKRRTLNKDPLLKSINAVIEGGSGIMNNE